MKKSLLAKTLSVLMCLTLVFSSAACSRNETVAVAARKSGPITADDMLHTDGKEIFNAKGEKIVLKGVNLGSWLICETWMTPVASSDDNMTTLNILTERFGVEKAYELINIYEDNWITEYDLDKIAELGFNCVRVPFWFRNFYYDDQGTKILDENGEWDFSRLDWVVSECSKRGLYVILDLHGAPGFQGNKDHCGKANSCGLFDSSDEAERWRELTIELWTAVATRFSGNPAVAMYDLLNEPNCDVPSKEKHSLTTISVFNRLYKAIREVDSDHIITIEAIWRLYNIPAPWLMGWKNVVYQLHLYDSSNAEFEKTARSTKWYPYNVPIYIGEFKPLGDASWDFVLGLFNDTGFSWTLWSYKGCGDGADKSDWFLYGSKPGFERADVKNDDFDTIARKWGAAVRTEDNYADTGFYDIIKDYI